MTAANLLNFGKDQQGTSPYAPQVSNTKWDVALAQNMETHITLPTDYANYIVLFAYSSGATILVDCTGATATIPANNTLQPTTQEVNPGQRTVPGGNKISMVTNDTNNPIVGVAIYGIP